MDPTKKVNSNRIYDVENLGDEFNGVDVEKDVENLTPSIDDEVDDENMSSLSERNTSFAVIGANTCSIESLDYERIEIELFEREKRSRKKFQKIQYVFLKWALALLIGLITGLIGFFNNITIENIAGFKLLLTKKLMLEGNYIKAFIALAGCNTALAVAGGILCAFVAPAAAGSGIPEVKSYLNGVDAPSILAPTTLFVKIFGSLLGVSSGLVVGKQGPLVHTGACIANLLGQGGSRRYGLARTQLKYFSNDRERRDMITYGAAAGVAAAFRAPIGGVLFALEEATSWWENRLLWRTFLATTTVALVLRGLIQQCKSSKCGLFGKGGLIMFDVSQEVATYGGYDVVAVVILGVLGGVLGSLYNYFVDKVLRTYKIINKKGPFMRIFLVIAVSFLTTCCAFGLPWLANCIPCPANSTIECPTHGREFGYYKSFQCPHGYYNDLASLFLNTSDNAIRNLLSSTIIKQFHISSLFLFFVAIYFLGIITYGIAIPGGLFIPIILAGSVYGRIIGRLFRLTTSSTLNIGLFSLLGAASLLGGTVRSTLSLCIILLELTNNLLLLPLVMVAVLISKTVADSFNIGLYEQIVKIKDLPYLEARPESYMKTLLVKDALSREPLVAFSRVEKVMNIVHALQITQHNGFPVIIDDEPTNNELHGLVLRSHLLVLLKAKYFSKEKVVLEEGDFMKKFSPLDFAKPNIRKRKIKLEDLNITEKEMEMYIDLHPITNTSPYTVLETMSLAKAKLLFRLLGLRHLCVVPKSQGTSPIIGILTRRDFRPEHLLKLHPHLVKSKK